jgi:long-subunit fatty acid transport protein
LTGGYEFADWAFDVGLQWQPARPLTIGAVYHVGFTADFDYYETKELAQYDWAAAQPVPYEPTSSRETTTVEWPSGWGAGLAWRATDTLTFTADYSEMSWSEAIVQDYRPAVWDADAQPVVGLPRDVYFPFAYEQKDSWTARAGAEFVIVLGSGALLPLRAGYFQERQFAALSPYYSQEPATFDGYSLGTGFAYKNVQFDIAWVHTEGDDSISESYQYEEVIIIGGEPYRVNVQATEDNVFDFASDRYLASIIIRF